MSHSQGHLMQKAIVGMALVLFVGGGFATATNYWVQKSDYSIIVDGQRVPGVDFQRRLVETRQMFTHAGAKLPEAELKQQALTGLIQRTLLLREAEKRNLQVSEQEISQEWQRLLKEAYGGSSERMRGDLIKSYYSETDFHDELRDRLLMRKTETALETGFKVSDARLQTYYKEHQAEFSEPERIQASHILIKADHTKPAEMQRAKAKAEDVIRQLQGGADFKALAKQDSDDAGSKVNGGDLGSFRKGDMVPAFESAAWKLKPGEFTQTPVQTDFGWHVILRGQTLPARVKPFNEVKTEIVGQLVEAEKRNFMQDWLKRQQAASRIQIHPSLAGPELKKVTPQAEPSNASLRPETSGGASPVASSSPEPAALPSAKPTPARFQSAIPPIKN